MGDSQRQREMEKECTQRYQHGETETESEVQKRPEIHAQRESGPQALGLQTLAGSVGRCLWQLGATGTARFFMLLKPELFSFTLESQRQLSAAAPDVQTKKVQTSFWLAHFQLRLCPQE